MEPHPDFADLALPRDFGLASWRLTPLAPDFVDEDLAAALKAAPLLDGVFGDWPAGLTRAENLIDLAWHEREFTTRRSFAWIVRDGAGTYLGCFYIYPAMGARGRATATLWLGDIPDREAQARGLHEALAGWMETALPPGIAIAWATSPRLA